MPTVETSGHHRARGRPAEYPNEAANGRYPATRRRLVPHRPRRAVDGSAKPAPRIGGVGELEPIEQRDRGAGSAPSAVTANGLPRLLARPSRTPTPPGSPRPPGRGPTGEPRPHRAARVGAGQVPVGGADRHEQAVPSATSSMLDLGPPPAVGRRRAAPRSVSSRPQAPQSSSPSGTHVGAHTVPVPTSESAGSRRHRATARATRVDHHERGDQHGRGRRAGDPHDPAPRDRGAGRDRQRLEARRDRPASRSASRRVGVPAEPGRRLGCDPGVVGEVERRRPGRVEGLVGEHDGAGPAGQRRASAGRPGHAPSASRSSVGGSPVVVVAHRDSSFRRSASPRWRRLRTVPTGHSRISAIWS